MSKYPIGIDHVRKYLPKLDSKGMDGLQYAFAAYAEHEKEYDRLMQAYCEHFDEVIDNEVIVPIQIEFATHGIVMPFIEIEHSQHLSRIECRLLFQEDEQNYQYTIMAEQHQLYEQAFFDYLKNYLAHYFAQRHEEKQNKVLWESLSDDEQDVMTDIFQGDIPRFGFISRVNEHLSDKELIADLSGFFILTKKGYKLIGWAHRNEKLEY